MVRADNNIWSVLCILDLYHSTVWQVNGGCKSLTAAVLIRIVHTVLYMVTSVFSRDTLALLAGKLVRAAGPSTYTKIMCVFGFVLKILWCRWCFFFFLNTALLHTAGSLFIGAIDAVIVPITNKSQRDAFTTCHTLKFLRGARWRCCHRQTIEGLGFMFHICLSSEFIKWKLETLGFYSDWVPVTGCNTHDSSAHLSHLCSLLFRHTSKLCWCIVRCCIETLNCHNFLQKIERRTLYLNHHHYRFNLCGFSYRGHLHISYGLKYIQLHF